MNIYESISLVLLTIGFVALVLLSTWLLMLGWNWAIHPLGVPTVGFWQMLVIQILAHVLFKNTVEPKVVKVK